MAASIDRVFGFDMGLKSVTDLRNMETLLRMIIHFCSLCGYKLRDQPYEKGVDIVSPTWETALAVYNENKPVLGLYGKNGKL